MSRAMYKSTATLVLLTIFITWVNAQCSCRTKPPIDVIYKGEACECGRKYPVQMEVPKITEHRDAHYDYGFTIERPQQPPAEVKYTFDFHMEKPKPIPAASLATYAFQVEAPAQKAVEMPQRYKFDYQLQTPVAKNDPSILQGLLAHVDRIVVRKPDCQEKTGCQCNSYKPTIDLLQRCPKHGHLYQSGGALYPNQQRYDKDLSSSEPQAPLQNPIPSERTKRDVTKTFPIKALPILFPSNSILKATPSVEDENQLRIDDIMRKNFGEDPSENMEELLRPKPLRPTQKFESNVDEDESIVMPPTKPDFVVQIQPKLQEARAKLRREISKIVNKARYEAIKSQHLIHKRSAEHQESNLSDVFVNDDGIIEEPYEPIWMAAEHVDGKIDDPTEEIELSEATNGDFEYETIDRVRKHCDRCGELAKKFPCPSCGGMPSQESQLQNGETKQENQNLYLPGQLPEHSSQPKYVVDEYEGGDVTVGNYHNGPGAYGELQHILDKNSGAIYSQNRRIGEGHLIQPMNFAHATDAIRFIQGLTQRSNDMYDNSNAGDSSQNFHTKRSFKIVPLAENNDGSVFLKISPVQPSGKFDNQPKSNKAIHKFPGENRSRYELDVTKSKSKLDGIEFSEVKPKPNFKKFVRNGKNFEILTLNGSDEGSSGSAEDMDILKYVYAVNQKDRLKDNEEIIYDAQT